MLGSLVNTFVAHNHSLDTIYLILVKTDQIGIDKRNPLTILKEYIAQQNFRLVDLFKQLDKDGGGSISRDEFIDGLKVANILSVLKHYITGSQ